MARMSTYWLVMLLLVTVVPMSFAVCHRFISVLIVGVSWLTAEMCTLANALMPCVVPLQIACGTQL
jgi:hypothetical protein